MEKEIRILMLEDLEEDAGLIDRALKRENIPFIRTRVDTENEFIEALDQFKPDLILSDHSLPQFNSIDALKICQERKIEAPFILVTGAVSDEFAVSCLKMGAVDYVLKSNLSRLPKAIQQALQQYQAEKNRVLQADELREQNEKLIKVNRELDAFIYRVSHDLRSPLSSILGLTGVARLEKDMDGLSAGKYFEMIEKNVLRLDETLREILDYYKNARGEVVYESVDLEKLVYKCLEQLNYVSGFKDVKKEVVVSINSPLESDGYRCAVILLNLLSNAIKYRDEAKEKQFVNITLTVTTNHAIIEIQDNGIGIQEELQPKIFDMFYRATDKSDGAGLGLYIVKEMVDKLNGYIDVISTYTKGTTIRICLPNAAE